jgi:hypothetical protein
MISMNISPPRPIEASSPARLPALNAGRRNRPSRNIGCGTRLSMKTNRPRSATPPARQASTTGLVQPMGLEP